MRSGSKLPDFLIIGAAKSGTTSLFYYLREHPSIFLPAAKELNFFSYDPAQDELLLGPGQGPGDRDATVWTPSLPEYQEWFSTRGARQIAGEASVSYLYSPISASRIKSFMPEAKLIAVLRDPVERAWSNYCHMVRDGREQLSFMEALRQEEKRIEERWEFSWHYKRLGLYGEQLARFFRAFPSENIRIFLFKDLIRDTGSVVHDILSFLGVDTTYDLEVETVHNSSGAVRSELLARFVNRPNVFTRMMRKVIPLSVGHRVMEMLRRINLEDTKPKIPSKARAYLADYYVEDVKVTGQLLERDLSHWISLQ